MNTEEARQIIGKKVKVTTLGFGSYCGEVVSANRGNITIRAASKFGGFTEVSYRLRGLPKDKIVLADAPEL